MERYFTSTERKTKNKKQNPVNPEFYKQKKKNESKIKTFSSKTKLREFITFRPALEE